MAKTIRLVECKERTIALIFRLNEALRDRQNLLKLSLLGLLAKIKV